MTRYKPVLIIFLVLLLAAGMFSCDTPDKDKPADDDENNMMRSSAMKSFNQNPSNSGVAPLKNLKVNEKDNEIEPKITPPASPSPSASPLDFDPDVLALLKQETGNEVKQGEGINSNGDEIKVPAYVAEIPHAKVEQTLASIRGKLKPGYMAFVWDNNYGFKEQPNDKIGIIKGNDPYELLRMRQTSGPNYNVTNERIIATLKEWEETYPFDIVGAEEDWVEIALRDVPADTLKLAQEAYKLCPDCVEQGAGSLKALAGEIKTKKRLFLWWD